ncbi:MAG TPA: outer membrane beta-barrel protein [Saprospiraceae bacterium]|nr:outer membrane beta-barrel protein [Saprospiraceae bacterium]HMQ85501.1 outer membrane beta-barrel protein [Saprospiraceae bacterium]
MKKFIFTLTICLSLAAATTLNAQLHVQGDINVNAGIGLLSFYNFAGTLDLPPIGGSVEYGVTDEISVGAYLAFSRSTWSYAYLGGEARWAYTYLIVGPRASYHFNLPELEELDLYAGAFLGATISSSTWKGTGSQPDVDTYGGLTYALFGGARYFFSENLGAFGEVGYGLSLLTVGICLHL